MLPLFCMIFYGNFQNLYRLGFFLGKTMGWAGITWFQPHPCVKLIISTVKQFHYFVRICATHPKIHTTPLLCEKWSFNFLISPQLHPKAKFESFPKFFFFIILYVFVRLIRKFVYDFLTEYEFRGKEFCTTPILRSGLKFLHQ